MSDKPHIFPQGSNKWKTRPRPPGQRMHTPTLSICLPSQYFPNTVDRACHRPPGVPPLHCIFGLVFQILLRHPAEESAKRRITVIVNPDSNPCSTESGDLTYNSLSTTWRRITSVLQHNQTSLHYSFGTAATNHSLSTIESILGSFFNRLRTG